MGTVAILAQGRVDPPAMSDDEHDFGGGDAGAADTVPKQAGDFRKGGYAMLKGHPCKVVEISTSKTGKHGHAKCHITGLDIFTGKKCEDLCPASHNMSCPVVGKSEYTVMDVAEDGALSLLTDGGEPKDDLNLPGGNDDLDKIAKQIKTDFEAGKGLIVSVLEAMGQEMVSGVRESQ